MSSTNHPEIPQSAYDEGLFIQPIAPIGNSLVGSFFVGVIPLVVVLIMLGAFRLPAHASSLTGLIVSYIWMAYASAASFSVDWKRYRLCELANYVDCGAVNAMFVYNIAVRSGVFDIFRRWIVTNTPPDMRVLLLVIGYAFGALLEGVAGFGTPGAICSALMVSLGFDKVKALTYTLIFDTTPVAFGALGIPVTTLANLTGLPVMSLSAMMGRQLPFVSVFLPIYAVTFFAGFRAGFLECWPAALVAGVSFALVQAIFANWVGPELPDLIAGLASLLSLIVFLRFWKPPYREEFACVYAPTKQHNDEESAGAVVPTDDNMKNEKHDVASAGSTQEHSDEKVEVSQVEKHNGGNSSPSGSGSDAKDDNSVHSKSGKKQGVAGAVDAPPDPESITPVSEIAKPTLYESILAWSPWVCIVVVVIIWSFVHVPSYGAVKVQWPQLHERVWLTLYGRKYAAIWNFEPLATGTAILISNIPFTCLVLYNGSSPKVIPRALWDTIKQLWIPILTVSFIMALAYLYNFSGIAYTIGMTLSSVGNAFPFLSAWLGWVACFLSGSDTSANSLFGNLQVVAAQQIGLSAVLMASTNSSGAVTAKMISPQTLSTGVSTIGMQGREGYVFRRTVLHSIFMCSIMGMIACIQQFGTPGIIPPGDEVLMNPGAA